MYRYTKFRGEDFADGCQITIVFFVKNFSLYGSFIHAFEANSC